MIFNTRISPPGSSHIRSQLYHAFKSLQVRRAEILLSEFGSCYSASSNLLHNPTSQRVASRGRAAFIHSTNNIGDEIQTLASTRFLGLGSSDRVVGIDREFLRSATFAQPQTLIMNGWFMHNAKQWPPADFIHPVFVGFHLANDELLSGDGLEYFRENSPIGCRDLVTQQKLESRGVDSYFSPCPTLTLPTLTDCDRRGVYLVDCADKRPDGHIEPVAGIVRKLVPGSILQNAIHLSHSVQKQKWSWYGWKVKQALKLLKIYSSAKLIITSRIHCALPCVAMGTPCIFLHKNLKGDARFSGYLDVLNAYDENDSKIAINWDRPEPADAWEIKALAVSCLQSTIRSSLASVSQVKNISPGFPASN